jgi:formylglycine-generating enzyme required for sulfatase activity
MPGMRRLPRFVVCVIPLALVAQRPAVPADAPAKLKAQTVTLGTARGGPDVGIELVQLPPGKITLRGADGKAHEHEVKPIWIAKHETRWDEYDVFWMALDWPERERRDRYNERVQTRASVPYHPPDGGFDPTRKQIWESPGHTGFPANCIHFQAAQRYCAWLSKQTGKRFRLPTEAEWEYACRAGGPPLKPDAEQLADVAWFADNSDDKPHPVGEKRPNPWGLYDMLGNVGEYVVRDREDTKGLLAGGSYKDAAKDVQSAAREPYSPDWQKTDPQDPKSTSWLNWDVHHVGFRVVMED